MPAQTSSKAASSVNLVSGRQNLRLEGVGVSDRESGNAGNRVTA